jgi:mRNA-degrading endonuclease YafQ of YafQ-DinJ toxin-antitoxin module
VILTRSSYRRAFQRLSATQQAAVNAAVARLPEAFGRPHLHSGIGIRPFGGFYECRIVRDMRVLFAFDRGDFVLVTAGNHDSLARFIRENC